MTGSAKIRTSSGQRSVVTRWYELAHTGWRKAATFAAALLALAMGYHVIFGQNGLTAYQQKRQETHTLQIQMHDLERENDQLKAHVNRLQHDPGAIEHQARQELHYTRPGEVIYTMPKTPDSQTK